MCATCRCKDAPFLSIQNLVGPDFPRATLRQRQSWACIEFLPATSDCGRQDRAAARRTGRRVEGVGARDGGACSVFPDECYIGANEYPDVKTGRKLLTGVDVSGALVLESHGRAKIRQVGR